MVMVIKNVSASELLNSILSENAKLYGMPPPSNSGILEDWRTRGLITDSEYNEIDLMQKNATSSSEYQDADMYHSLERIFVRIAKSLNKTFGAATDDIVIPTFGSVYMNQFTAQVKKHHIAEDTILISTDYVVLFSNELINFAGNLSKLIAEIVVYSDDSSGLLINKNKLMESAIDNKRFKKAFCLILLDYFTDTTVTKEEYRYTLLVEDPHKFRLASVLTYSYLVFVLSHEYAHFSSEFPYVQYQINANMHEEIMADLVSYLATVDVLNESGIALALVYIGIFLSLDSLIVIDRLNEMKFNIKKSSIDWDSTHLPGKERRKLFKDFLTKGAHNSSALLEYIDTINEIIEMCLLEFEHLLGLVKDNNNEYSLTQLRSLIYYYYDY